MPQKRGDTHMARLTKSDDLKSLEGTPYENLRNFFIEVWEFANHNSTPDIAPEAADKFFASLDEWRRKDNEEFRESLKR